MAASRHNHNGGDTVIISMETLQAPDAPEGPPPYARVDPLVSGKPEDLPPYIQALSGESSTYRDRNIPAIPGRAYVGASRRGNAEGPQSDAAAAVDETQHQPPVKRGRRKICTPARICLIIVSFIAAIIAFSIVSTFVKPESRDDAKTESYDDENAESVLYSRNPEDYPVLPTGVFKFTIPPKKASSVSSKCTTNDRIWNCNGYSQPQMASKGAQFLWKITYNPSNMSKHHSSRFRSPYLLSSVDQYGPQFINEVLGYSENYTYYYMLALFTKTSYTHSVESLVRRGSGVSQNGRVYRRLNTSIIAALPGYKETDKITQCMFRNTWVTVRLALDAIDCNNSTTSYPLTTLYINESDIPDWPGTVYVEESRPVINWANSYEEWLENDSYGGIFCNFVEFDNMGWVREREMKPRDFVREFLPFKGGGGGEGGLRASEDDYGECVCRWGEKFK
ncbi:hypothetical protein BDD12DRAFT_375955 [Trichophaea hybrida]|nr:hypothetical protein BDD12DRAFT_375955 [Trichophaea hybrida]